MELLNFVCLFALKTIQGALKDSHNIAQKILHVPLHTYANHHNSNKQVDNSNFNQQIECATGMNIFVTDVVREISFVIFCI